MKKIQGQILKIAVSLACIVAFSLNGNANAFPEPGMSAPAKANPNEDVPEMKIGKFSSLSLAKADSLFRLKQYTESFELYNSLFQRKLYSPSMLLKMAYIQEGLGHLAQSMYYLNLYYLVTHDTQALAKLEDLATKNKLEGYASSDATRLVTLLKEHYAKVVAVLASMCVFFVALLFYEKIKKKRLNVVALVSLILLAALLFGNNYLTSHSTQGIISNSATYLMEGPSAGSSVIGIVGEGHRVEILAKQDVWLRVKWTDKEVFVKETELLPVRL